MQDWIPPKSTPTPPTPPAPPLPADPSADEASAWLVELEDKLGRAAMAVLRLWAEIHDLNKEG